MDIENTALWNDVKRILDLGPRNNRTRYVATIHTKQEDFDAFKIVTFDILRDYLNNVGDQVMIDLLLPLGDYAKRLYPFRDNLEITLTREEIGSFEKVDGKKSFFTERFKAIFLQKENHSITSTDIERYSKDTLDLTNIVNVKLQLMNRSLEPLRIKTTGGIFTNTNHENLIQSVLGAESLKVLVDGKPAVDGISVVKPSNPEALKHVVIPQGMHITALTTFLQEKMGGVYNAGMACYFQNYQQRKTWFVFPPYNTRRFKENIPKLVFIMVPSSRFPSIERTFRTEGDVTYILVTSRKQYTDSGETNLMNTGSGFRLTDARAMMGKPVAMTEDGPVAQRNQINHETVVKQRLDNLNYAPVSSSGLSGNPFVEYSKVLANSTGRMFFTWENADPQLIYPGMPCKVLFMEKDTLCSSQGTVIMNHVFVSLASKGFTSDNHVATCQIGLCVDSYGNPDE